MYAVHCTHVTMETNVRSCQKWKELLPHPMLTCETETEQVKKKNTPLKTPALEPQNIIPTVEDHLPYSRTSWVWVNMGLIGESGEFLSSLTSLCWEWTPFDCKLIINHECDLHKSSYTDDWHWWYMHVYSLKMWAW